LFVQEIIMSHEKTIADLAYHLWHARGCPHGSAEIDWAEAERQVRGRPADRALDAPVPANGLTHSTPAPPATPAPQAAGAKPAVSRAQVDKPTSVEKPSRAEKPATRVASDQGSAAADGPVTRTKKKTKR
jgi:hypothetical protein